MPAPPHALASRSSRAVRAAVIAGLVAVAQPAAAGLSFDEALARSRALVAGGPTPIGLAPLDAPSARRLTLGVGGPGGDLPPLLRPQIDGDGGFAYEDGTRLLGDRVALRLGVAYDDGERRPLTLDGSSLSTAFGAGRLYASVERRHWGPAWTGGLILDAASRAVPAVGWRKDAPAPFASPWLGWLGPWQLDLFAGQLSQESGPARAKLFGARVQAMPLAGLEIGLSRTIQWGGRGRPETLRSFWNALVGRDNYDDRASSDANEPGNQLAGGDVRWQLRLGERWATSLYAETIGEDEAGNLPSRRLLTFGLDAAYDVPGLHLRVFGERADVTMDTGSGSPPRYVGAYRHPIYTAGYTQLGSPLGHPAGGDVRLWSAGIYAGAGRWSGALLGHRGRAFPTAQLYPGGGKLGGVQGELAWQVDARSTLGVVLARWRHPDQRVARGQLWWSLVLP